jgi:hypothetical protein
MDRPAGWRGGARPRVIGFARTTQTHPIALASAEPSGDLVGDYLRLIVLTVARAIDDRDPAVPRNRCERVERLGPYRLGKLRVIALLKLSPARGIVAKPLPEASTWAEIPGPGVEPELGLRPAPRPNPVDKHAMPIVRLWIVVRAP